MIYNDRTLYFESQEGILRLDADIHYYQGTNFSLPPDAGEIKRPILVHLFGPLIGRQIDLKGHGHASIFCFDHEGEFRSTVYFNDNYEGPFLFTAYTPWLLILPRVGEPAEFTWQERRLLVEGVDPFAEYSDEELLQVKEREAGIHGWVGSRGIHLSLLERALAARELG